MKLKKLITSLILCTMALCLCACGSEEETDTTPAGVAVQVTTVGREDVSTAHRVSGTVSDADAATIYASSDAVIGEVYVTAGQEVKAGDKLCHMESGSLFVSYNAADAAYLSTVSAYFNQKDIFAKQIALYEKLWKDTQKLYSIGAASRLEVEQAELQYLGGIAQRDSTMSQIESGLENYKAYQEMRSVLETDADGDAVAPFDGTVDAWNLTEGNTPSDRYPEAVITGERGMKVTAYVSEAMMALLREGDRANVKLNAIGADIDGTIRSISDTVNQQTRMYTVSVGLPDNVDGLVAGLFADISFYTDTAAAAVAVPGESILTYDGKEYVFVVEGNTARYVEIKTGLVGDGITQVTAGLNGGEQIVTVGQQYLTDGAAVRIVSVEG